MGLGRPLLSRFIISAGHSDEQPPKVPEGGWKLRKGVHRTVRFAKRRESTYFLLLTVMTLQCLAGDSSDVQLCAPLSTLTAMLSCLCNRWT